MIKSIASFAFILLGVSQASFAENSEASQRVLNDPKLNAVIELLAQPHVARCDTSDGVLKWEGGFFHLPVPCRVDFKNGFGIDTAFLVKGNTSNAAIAGKIVTNVQISKIEYINFDPAVPPK